MQLEAMPCSFSQECCAGGMRQCRHGAQALPLGQHALSGTAHGRLCTDQRRCPPACLVILTTLQCGKESQPAGPQCSVQHPWQGRPLPQPVLSCHWPAFEPCWLHLVSNSPHPAGKARAWGSTCKTSAADGRLVTSTVSSHLTISRAWAETWGQGAVLKSTSACTHRHTWSHTATMAKHSHCGQAQVTVARCGTLGGGVLPAESWVPALSP